DSSDRRATDNRVCTDAPDTERDADANRCGRTGTPAGGGDDTPHNATDSEHSSQAGPRGLGLRVQSLWHVLQRAVDLLLQLRIGHVRQAGVLVAGEFTVDVGGDVEVSSVVLTDERLTVLHSVSRFIEDGKDIA